ncbi:MAG: hypothetical protein WBI14_00570 [Anaerolineaceae bacterium]
MINKLGIPIASSYWICPNGQPGYQVNQYNIYRSPGSSFEITLGYLPNSLNACGGNIKYVGGTHMYEYQAVQDFVWAVHQE